MVIRLIPMFSIVDARLQVWPRARSGRPGDFAPLPLPGWSAITRLCEQSARDRRQYQPSAGVDRLPHPRGPCCEPDRNRPSRSATRKRRGPACRSHGAEMQNKRRDPGRRWMKTQGQVTAAPALRPGTAPGRSSSRGGSSRRGRRGYRSMLTMTAATYLSPKGLARMLAEWAGPGRGW